MADHILETLNLVKAQVAELEDSLKQKKRVANDLCELADQPPLYTDLDTHSVSGIIHSDQFYGRPLATVAKEILLMKGHAVPVGDIYDAMAEGGFRFDAKSKDNSTRGLRISLSKNTTTFHKLPNGTYGLAEWYPNVKPARNGNGGDNGKPAEAEDEPVKNFGETQDGDPETVDAAKAAKG